MYGIGRHLELTPGLVVSTAARAGGRKSQLSRADYLKSVFAGQLGAGVAALYARDLGAMYLAHAEDVDGTLAQLTRVYRRPAPPSGSTKKPKMSTRMGDFLTVNAQEQFGMLEAKATASVGKVQTFMDRAVLDGARWQIDPFVPGTIQLPPRTPGVTAPSAAIEYGAVSGLNIHEAPSGAALHAILFETASPPPSALSLSVHVMATPHFKPWWRLFNLAFMDLNLPRRPLRLSIMNVGSMSFVTNIPTPSGYFSRQRFSGIRQQGWATNRSWNDWIWNDHVFLAIEEGIFRQLLAAFTGRRGVRLVRDETGGVRRVQQADNDAMGEPEAIHAAVQRFQLQLSEQTGFRQDQDPTGRLRLQAWKALMSEVVSNEWEVAVFREGVMAFEGSIIQLMESRNNQWFEILD